MSRRLRTIESDGRRGHLERPDPDAPDAESYPIDRALGTPKVPYQEHPSGNRACERCQVTWYVQADERSRCWVCGRFGGVRVAAGTALHRWKKGCQATCPSMCDSHLDSRTVEAPNVV